MPNPELIASLVSVETGLAFSGRRLPGGGSDPVIELTPAGHVSSQTFTLRATVEWRSVVVRFTPGAFASDLVTEMGRADLTGRTAFAAILASAAAAGAAIDFKVNGATVDWADPQTWEFPWTSAQLELRKGQLPLRVESADTDRKLVARWTGQVASAVIALLPLEATETPEQEVFGFAEEDVVFGFAEGGGVEVKGTRYERDRRNRVAALAIHGFACQVCETVLSDVYGDAAAGFIEVHHLTPVSVIEAGYVIDPKLDLAPLCPNCHGMAHRRIPPYSLDELRMMVSQKRHPT